MSAEDTYRCIRCKTVKPISAYYSVMHYQCKECRKEIEAARYKAHRERILERNRRYRQRVKEALCNAV